MKERGGLITLKTNLTNSISVFLHKKIEFWQGIIIIVVIVAMVCVAIEVSGSYSNIVVAIIVLLMLAFGIFAFKDSLRTTER